MQRRERSLTEPRLKPVFCAVTALTWGETHAKNHCAGLRGYVSSLLSGPAGGFFLPGTTRLWQISPVSAVSRKRMHVLYSGRVQGVGFRYTVKSVASGFDAT